MRSDAAAHAQIGSVVDQFSGRIPAGGTVVDVGCGTGQHAVELASRGFNVIGIDYAPAMLARARNHARVRSLAIEFRERDLKKGLAFAVDSLEAALCVSVMQVVDEPARLLGQLREALRPGGHVLIESVWRLGALSCGNHLGVHDRIINGAKKLGARFPGVVRLYQPDNVAAMLDAAGFAVAGTNTFDATFTVLGRRP
jgi:SAM-dependent methyltransferase